ncbi:carbon storage regulator [Marinobacterium sediminicola]|uniref:Carbon storage regulator, CsrA n=1 Tax=Marinobacterium sediminicola TaxID=518898 RepID=A0ABY1S3K0_9GAMM|nr:carbon storage regulator [Marinobacterium sediminicola]ULG69293.1 carbon storage regulator [Marinobacterium sediminicola]SMR77643.1 carbon storage regulator, CsrA [Marinobacterium sediminicola]
MLYITLKEDEQLYIGDNIVLSFYRHQDPLLKRCRMPCDTQQVKLAIDAPQSVKVLRSEIIGRS